MTIITNFKGLLIQFKAKNLESFLLKGVTQAFFIQGFGAVLLLVIEILVARVLGIQQFGEFSIAMAWLYILSLLGTLGFNHALLRFVPTYIAHGQWANLRGLIRRSNLWATLISLSFVAVGFIFIFAFKKSLQLATYTVVFALLAIPFQVILSLRQATLRALGKITYALIPEFILRPIVFITLLIFAAVFDKSIDATYVLFLNLMAVITAFLIGAIWQSKFLPTEIKLHLPAYNDRKWLFTALALLMIVGFNLISGRIGVILLGIFSKNEYVGMYAAATKVSDIVVFALVSANAVAAPLIAGLYATKKHDELQRVLTSLTKGIALFTIPVALLLICFGRNILNIFGAEFSQAYLVLVILVCGQIVNSLTGPVGYLMTMTGHHNQAAKIVAFSAVLNLLVSLCLIPPFGMIGAAISTSISVVTWNILMLRFVKINLSINPSLFGFWIK